MNLLSDKQLMRKMSHCGHPYSKRLFIGVFPRDCLPKRIPHYPCSLIINTDTKNLPGKHWVSIFISSYKVGEYFDSFGHEPPQDIARWLNKFTLNWNRVNYIFIQNPFSTTCGQFVLYFVNERPLVQSKSHIVRVFYSDTNKNEAFLKHYYQEKFKDC